MSRIRKAERRQVAVKIAISAAAGGGKTMTALRLAMAMAAKQGGRVCLIDSEAGSGELYQGEVTADGVVLDYDVLPLERYDVDSYLAAMREVADSGDHSVMIVDSTSHLWAGSGGLLEEVDRARDKFGEGWRNATPKYNRFLSAVLTFPKDAIFTLRAKQEYAQEKDSNGKTKVRKLGIAPIIREGFDYEVTLAMLLDEQHNADITKSRISKLDGTRWVKPGADLAKVVMDWRESGAPGAAPESAGGGGNTGNANPAGPFDFTAALAEMGVSADDLAAFRLSQGAPDPRTMPAGAQERLLVALKNEANRKKLTDWIAANRATSDAPATAAK
jgi:hypothetical protein